MPQHGSWLLEAGGWTEFLHCDWPSWRTRKGLNCVCRNVWGCDKMSECLAGNATGPKFCVMFTYWGELISRQGGHTYMSTVHRFFGEKVSMTRDAELYRPTDRPKGSKIRRVKRNKSVLPNGAATYSLIYDASEHASRLNFVLWLLIFSAKFLQSPPHIKNRAPTERFSRHYSIAACHRSGTQILDITLRYIDNLCSLALQATTVPTAALSLTEGAVRNEGNCEICVLDRILFSHSTRTKTNKLTNIKITFLHAICQNSDMF